MQLKILQEIIKKKIDKSEFAIITNLENSNSEIFELDKPISKNFEKYKDQINEFYKNKKNGIIENTNIFVETYIRPIKVIIVGAVHIAQYLIDYAKSLNFEIIVIDPRGYFATEQRFPSMEILNKWPDEAFKEIETNSNTALIALTHDPKIDDPALQHALKKKFYYIGALGSKKTHAKRCERLKESGFNEDEINSIHGPIGIKLGGKSAPEIALSIIAQLVLKLIRNEKNIWFYDVGTNNLTDSERFYNAIFVPLDLSKVLTTERYIGYAKKITSGNKILYYQTNLIKTCYLW